MTLLNSKKLFLIDGLAALLSAFLLGFFLVRFEPAFGMPRNVLYVLSAIAFALAAYSLAHYFLVKEIRKAHLKIIGYANLFYCFLILALTLYFYSKITILGELYFLGEICIIVMLAMLELRNGNESSGV